MRQPITIVRWQLSTMINMPEEEISYYVDQEDWNNVPKPAVKGQNKWVLDDVLDWHDARRAESQKEKKQKQRAST